MSLLFGRRLGAPIRGHIDLCLRLLSEGPPPHLWSRTCGEFRDHSCTATHALRLRLGRWAACITLSTYAAFLCLPNALLVGLPPGPVKAISIIEQLGMLSHTHFICCGVICMYLHLQTMSCISSLRAQGYDSQSDSVSYVSLSRHERLYACGCISGGSVCCSFVCARESRPLQLILLMQCCDCSVLRCNV